VSDRVLAPRPPVAILLLTGGMAPAHEGWSMSFIKRAQEAAAQAAAMANRTASDPATQEAVSRSAREAVGMARRGVTTVIEKIDPNTLAELIVRATALQEMTNTSLREKGSPYRIAEISISASIPPAVSFAISRLGDEPEEVVGKVVSSAELIEQAEDAGELVIALDGTTVDDSAIAAPEVGVDGDSAAMPPSSVSRS
jgi:hypothetical protein